MDNCAALSFGKAIDSIMVVVPLILSMKSTTTKLLSTWLTVNPNGNIVGFVFVIVSVSVFLFEVGMANTPSRVAFSAFITFHATCQLLGRDESPS